MQERIAQATIALIATAVLICPTVVSAETPPPTRAEKWAWQPYDVTVELSVSLALENDTSWLPLYRTSLPEILSTTFGPLWRVRIVAAGTSAAASPATPLAAIPPPASGTKPTSARMVIPEDRLGKKMALSLDLRGSTVLLTATEYDEFTQNSSHTIGDICGDPSRLDWATAKLLAQVFRPVSLVEPIRGGGVAVTVRGERLWPDNLPRATVRPSEVFYRYLNKSRILESIQPVPFTYLVSEQDTPENAPEWTVVSGLRSPLSSRRQRVDVVGLSVGPLAAATRLTLQSRRSAARKLAGLDLNVNHFGSSEPLRRISDRAGQVVLTPPVDTQPPEVTTTPIAPGEHDDRDVVPAGLAGVRSSHVTQIEVRSGKAVLARIPFVVGSHREVTLDLQDDTLRLNVEGDLAILQAGVIDAVSRRAVLMARIRRDARLGIWPAVDSGLKELDSMPNLQKFRSDLAGLQLPAQSLARADRDRQTEARIKRLCQDTNEMMARFLADEPVLVLRSEINDLKTALRDAEAAQKRAEEKRIADEKAAIKKAEERRAAPVPKAPATKPAGGTSL